MILIHTTPTLRVANIHSTKVGVVMHFPVHYIVRTDVCSVHMKEALLLVSFLHRLSYHVNKHCKPSNTGGGRGLGTRLLVSGVST